MKCNAVIGHCGWDTVLLICTDNLDISERVVAKNIYTNKLLFPGDEIGFLSKKSERNHIRLRIIDRVTQDYLPMCGGMSQVIGKSLIETSFRELFNIEIKDRKCNVFMETDSGVVELVMDLDEKGNKVLRVFTQMLDFSKFLSREGIEEVKLSKVEGIKVGYFLLLDIQSLNNNYDECIFEDRTDNNHKEVLISISKEYLLNTTNKKSLYIMMYDTRCEDGGDIKFYGRFFRDGKMIISPDFEAHCGTGAVAVTLGLLKFKRDILISTEIQNNQHLVPLSITYEFGNKKIQEERDPYGLRKSTGKIFYEGEISSFLYSHEIIEMIFDGIFHIPLF